jgi:hypothetical protein
MGYNTRVHPGVAEPEWHTRLASAHATASVPRPKIPEEHAPVERLTWPQAAKIIAGLNVLGWAPVLGILWLAFG